jgi:hypothetical protein
MENTTYEDGESPNIGDTVKVAHKNKLDSYSDLVKYGSKDRQYTVVAIGFSTNSKLLKLRDVISGHTRANPISCSNLRLISSTGITVRIPPQHLIVSDGKIRAAVSTDSNLSSKLAELLVASPNAEFHVFEYLHTAKATAPQIELVDRRNPPITSPTLPKPYIR